MFGMGKIIGKTVVAIKAIQIDRRKKKNLEPRYILFEDEETFIELSEQDYYCFHDCSTLARNIWVRRDARSWKHIFDNKNGHYPDANCDI